MQVPEILSRVRSRRHTRRSWFGLLSGVLLILVRVTGADQAQPQRERAQPRVPAAEPPGTPWLPRPEEAKQLPLESMASEGRAHAESLPFDDTSSFPSDIGSLAHFASSLLRPHASETSTLPDFPVSGLPADPSEFVLSTSADRSTEQVQSHTRRRATVSGSSYTALSSLYSSTNGANWITRTNWMNGGDPCTESW